MKVSIVRFDRWEPKQNNEGGREFGWLSIVEGSGFTETVKLHLIMQEMTKHDTTQSTIE